MAVTGWLESLRAAEKTALLQDGNWRRPAGPLALPRVRPPRSRPGEGLGPGPERKASRPPPKPGPTLADEETEVQRDDVTGTRIPGHPLVSCICIVLLINQHKIPFPCTMAFAPHRCPERLVHFHPS